MKPPVYFLVGPTGVGKSQAALALARRVGGEIISADSMQVYRGMDIGTAKPSKRDRKRVCHHLLDFVAPERSFSVYQFRRQALARIREITARGKIPIVVGGSGLYVRALLEGLSEPPGRDASVRSRLEREAGADGLSVLHGRLQALDSEAGRRIHPSDRCRIIRALEIAQLSAKKPSFWRGRGLPLEALGYRPVVVGLTRERSELYDAINARVDGMFRRGLVAEVRRLAKRRLSRTASQAVGYKELLPLCRGGGRPGQGLLDRAREVIKRNSRRLAKRQWTWFRRERGIVWIPCEGGLASPEGGPAAAGLCDRILQALVAPAPIVSDWMSDYDVVPVRDA